VAVAIRGLEMTSKRAFGWMPFTDLKAELAQFKESCGRNWLAMFYREYGVLNLDRWFGVDAVAEAVDELTDDRMKVWRVYKEFEKAKNEHRGFK